MGILEAHPTHIVWSFELKDLLERPSVASERHASSQQDEIKRSVFVEVSELDGCFTLTCRGVVIAVDVTVSVADMKFVLRGRSTRSKTH